MHDFPLLINIGVALVVAFIGGLVARRLGLPTIVGYLIAGVLIGPFTPGFVGDIKTISQLAEMGVIFLMFGVGLHFSLADLWRVRDIAIPGAIGQMLIATLVGLGLSLSWGWSLQAGIVLGLSISIASTVVLLRGLMDNSLLNTPHGQAAVGWLVMEDLATVFILVMMPSIAATSGEIDWRVLGATLAKAVVFVLIVLLAGARLIPLLLKLIANTRSRELFILAILAVALGTALGAAELFGVSLALGAFVAGVVVSESPLSHQVAADVLPFREAFAVLFFVSIGMLVNPAYLISNIWMVIWITFLIVIGKLIITLFLGLFIRRAAMTILVTAVGLSQIGEFSFMLGQSGVALNILNADQYSLILAGSIISITANPFMFRSIPFFYRWLQRFPRLWNSLNRHGTIPASLQEELNHHVVIVGYGRVGRHMVRVLDYLQIPHLVIEADVERVEELNRRGTKTLYGDAANSEVIEHAGLDRAAALVVSTPEDATNELIVVAARQIAPDLPIIARAATATGVVRLSECGANNVIQPELEGGLEIISHTLLELGFAPGKVSEYTSAVRADHYDIQINTNEEHRRLQDLLYATEGIEIVWLPLEAESYLIGQTLAEANLRARTGASVVAILRGKKIIPNPKSLTVFEANDRIGVIGDPLQIEMLQELLEKHQIAS